MFENGFKSQDSLAYNLRPNFKILSRGFKWFHLKLYSMFQDLSTQLNLVFGGFETRLKFIKFGLRTPNLNKEFIQLKV